MVEEDPCLTQSHPSLHGDQRGGQGGPTLANKQGLYLPFLPRTLSPEPTKVKCFVFSFSGSAPFPSHAPPPSKTYASGLWWLLRFNCPAAP